MSPGQQFFVVVLLFVVALLLARALLPDPVRPAVTLSMAAGPVRQIPGGGLQVQKTITDHQLFNLTLAPKDAGGQPAKVDGVPAWNQSGDPNVVALTPSADGLSCEVRALGPTGIVTVTATADADLGEGVMTLEDTCDVQVIAGPASTLGLSAGETVEQA